MFHSSKRKRRERQGRQSAMPLLSMSLLSMPRLSMSHLSMSLLYCVGYCIAMALMVAGLLYPVSSNAQTALKFVAPAISQAQEGNSAEAADAEEETVGIPEAVVEKTGTTELKFSEQETAAEPLVDTNTLLESLTPVSDEKSEPETTEVVPETTVSAGTAVTMEPVAEENPTAVPGQEASDSPATPPANTVAKAPYDPIKENGEYFAGWEKPDAAIVFTGLLDGYIEPCGCAGMERMKGGLSRRETFLNDLKAKGWPVLAVDAGQLCTGFGVQEELKFDMIMNAFRLMDYQAIGMGRNDLKFPAYFLLTFTAPPSVSDQSRFVSANVGIYGYNKLYILPYKIVTAGTKRIGVTSVIFPNEDLSHRDENILLEDPVKKLKEILPQLLAEKTDHNILIVHGSEAETEQIAKQFPQFDFVITADSPSEPPAQPKIIGTNQYLIEPGEKGKFALVVGLYEQGETPVRYQRVALDSRYVSSQEIFRLMEEYQGILKTLITTKGYKGGLGMSLVDSDKRQVLGDFVGSEKCESCHEESYRIWKRSRHAVAWNSLTETAKPPRDFDPECISCHVIGWHGTENFPYAGGFVTEEKTPHLKQVGCESCHGPGSKHIEAELGDDEKLQDSIRTAMRLGNDTRRICFSCHDGDNSPDFDFDPYYKLIEHKELEE